MLLSLVKRFEQAVIVLLILLMSIIVAFSAVDLAKIIFQQLFTAPVMVVPVDMLLDLFGLFLLVLIGLELLEIIKAYAMENVVHVRVVVTVAMIAIARKVIILDVNEQSAPILLGIAGIIVALSVAHYALKGDDTTHKA